MNLLRQILFGTAAVLAAGGATLANDYTPATAPDTPQEKVMLAVAMAFVVRDQCPLVQVNKLAAANALLSVGVDIVSKDKESFAEHLEWAKAAVTLALLRGTPSKETFCTTNWKNFGPGSPLPLLEGIAK
jgi:hypothetical protein